MLDAVRAARLLPLAAASNETVLWGHSQGGHAAIFAAELAAEYAPELRVRAVAVAAPATSLSQLLNADIGDISGVTIGSYAFAAYANVYGASTPGASLEKILTPAGAAATPTMAGLCLLGQNAALHAIARPLVGGYLAVDPATVEPWATLLTENSPGATRLTVPLFVAQGETDTLVRPTLTSDFAEREKTLGTAVTYVSIPDTGHGLVALRALPRLMDWLSRLP
jgi:pimeloyl-ACP methyl ester carboxylesterase